MLRIQLRDESENRYQRHETLIEFTLSTQICQKLSFHSQRPKIKQHSLEMLDTMSGRALRIIPQLLFAWLFLSIQGSNFQTL